MRVPEGNLVRIRVRGRGRVRGRDRGALRVRGRGKGRGRVSVPEGDPARGGVAGERDQPRGGALDRHLVRVRVPVRVRTATGATSRSGL